MKSEPMQHANALPNTQSSLIQWLDRNGNAATVVACVAMIGGAIWYSYSRTSSSRNESAWAQYSQARSAEEFGNIADIYANTEVGAWARLGEGERLLDSGISLMFTDREAGLGELKKADEAFRKVLAMKSAAAATHERAAWGLAKSTETQSDSDTREAIEGYQSLLNQFPKSIYKAAAEERIEALKSADAKEFYAWFHKQKPKPPDLKKPKDGLPAGHPPIDLPIDEKPDSEKSTSEKTDDTKSEEKPKDDASNSVSKRLKTEVEIEFNRTPLQDAIKFIAEKCDVEIAIDSDALKDAGFTKNMPQTLELGKVSGLEGLAAILRKYEQEAKPIVLVIDEENGKAQITTKSFAEKAGLKPFEFSKPAESTKTDEPKEDKPKSDEPKSESKDKDAPAESK